VQEEEFPETVVPVEVEVVEALYIIDLLRHGVQEFIR
jgi:hypothetical protein